MRFMFGNKLREFNQETHTVCIHSLAYALSIFSLNYIYVCKFVNPAYLLNGFQVN